MTSRRRAWLGLARTPLPGADAGALLVINGFVGCIGTGLFLTGAVLYYTRVVGLSPGEVTAGLAAAGGCSLFAGVPLGALTDRLGPRRMMLWMNLWRLGGYGLLAVVHNFWQFLATLCAVTVADRCSPPVNQALVGHLFESDVRLRVMARLRAARNLGIALGALLAGIAITINSPIAYRSLVLANAISFAPMALLTVRLARYDGTGTANRAAEEPDRPRPQADRSPLRNVPFMVLASLTGVLSMSDSVLFVALPLWIVGSTHAPAATVSAALVLNTALTAVGQTWWTRWSRSIHEARRSLVASGLMLGAGAACFAASRHADAIVACGVVLFGVVLITFGENLCSAGAWQLSFALSPPSDPVRGLAAFNLGLSAQELYGPPAAAMLGTETGVPGWGGLALLFALSGLLAGASARRAQRPPARLSDVRADGHEPMSVP